MPPAARGQSKAQSTNPPNATSPHPLYISVPEYLISVEERSREGSQHNLQNRNAAPATATPQTQAQARSSGTSTPDTSTVQIPAATTASSNYVPPEVREYMHSSTKPLHRLHDLPMVTFCGLID